ncbi:Short-chain dehydrogenase/reductase 2b [Diplonema papillatum]|nr:Short-chain dehydrogenase/reductase 2b [Diplonema papillatum]
MDAKRLVVVTGGSRGLGRTICREILRKSPGSTVAMCTRKDVELSAEEKQWGPRLLKYQLDVTNKDDVARLVKGIEDRVHETKEPISLVNNAGVAHDLPWDPAPGPEVAQPTLDINLFGVHSVTESMLPLLRQQAANGLLPRVVMVSSGAGASNIRQSSPEMAEKLLGDLSWAEIEALARQFASEFAAAPARSTLSPAGFWLQSYGFSKALANAYTRLLGASAPGVVCHACSPGFVLTDMTGSAIKGGKPPEGLPEPMTPVEGAQTPVFLALGGGDNTPTAFWKKKEVFGWR